MQQPGFGHFGNGFGQSGGGGAPQRPPFPGMQAGSGGYGLPQQQQNAFGAQQGGFSLQGSFGGQQSSVGGQQSGFGSSDPFGSSAGSFSSEPFGASSNIFAQVRLSALQTGKAQLAVSMCCVCTCNVATGGLLT